jgi:hypothetical protein
MVVRGDGCGSCVVGSYVQQTQGLVSEKCQETYKRDSSLGEDISPSMQADDATRIQLMVLIANSRENDAVELPVHRKNVDNLNKGWEILDEEIVGMPPMDCILPFEVMTWVRLDMTVGIESNEARRLKEKERYTRGDTRHCIAAVAD